MGLGGVVGHRAAVAAVRALSFSQQLLSSSVADGHAAASGLADDHYMYS